jgi:hypothetical protein
VVGVTELPITFPAELHRVAFFPSPKSHVPDSLCSDGGGIYAMIELEVYAKGLRHGDSVLQLRNQMDVLPRVRYKIDSHHDLVYFEIDDPQEVSLAQLDEVFTGIGLVPRFVGQIPEAMRLTDQTTRII